MKNKRKIKMSRISKILEMPPEVVSDIPKISILGFDEVIIENYKNKVFVNQQENIELVTNYNVVEETNYNEEYNHEDYS